MTDDLEKLKSLIGEENLQKIIEHFGGSSIYFPQVKKFRLAELKKKIVEEFQKGKTVKQIARESKVSINTVYRLIDQLRRS
ncbi:MAG: helix-turn-helix domain-containing protein [Ignavibacteria bacterium]|nr:helix-turn-helix domain-containing protein [Ignavibacteria bacterium]